MTRDELTARYPALAAWLRVFFNEDWLGDYPNAVGSLQDTLRYFAEDRQQWINDVREFRVEFRTPDEQLAAAQVVQPHCTGDAADLSMALSLIEEKFLEEIETGVSYRDVLDDEGD